MSHKSKGIYLIRTKLISTWNEFKRNPNKLFLRNDFTGTTPSQEVYLKTLVMMGLIKEVPAAYRHNCGAVRKSSISINTKGYKLVKTETKQ